MEILLRGRREASLRALCSRTRAYVYDPAKPTRSAPDLIGAADTRLSAIGDEVLVYQTAPLQSAVEVVGPIPATR